MERDVYYVMGKVFGRLAKLNSNINMAPYTDQARQQLLSAFARLHMIMAKARLIDDDTQKFLEHYLDMIDVDDVPNTPMKDDDYNKFYFTFMQERNRLNEVDIIKRSGLQQQEIAEIAEVTRQTVARWEKARKIPMDAYLKIEDKLFELQNG